MIQPIPFLELSRLHDSIRPEIDDAVSRVIADSAFVGGAEVEAFEEEFAQAHGAAAAASCGSGTDALALALRALGIGPGDEVVVPAMTFVATAEAVVHAGARPVVADVDTQTLLLTREAVESVRTPQTRAVIPVHLYGHLVPFSEMDHWRAQGLIVLEDAAQAHLGSWRDAFVGSHSHAACFSFFPGKNLGALGDGGMVVSQNEEVISEIRRLRDHGRLSKYAHQVVGWCSRLDGLQAAVLRVKLRHLNEWTEARQAAASLYRAHLGDLLVPWDQGAVHHLMVARVANRGPVAETLMADGISTGIHYPRHLGQQPWLSAPNTSLPIASRAVKEVLSLPMDPLMHKHEVDRVARLLLQAVE